MAEKTQSIQTAEGAIQKFSHEKKENLNSTEIDVITNDTEARRHFIKETRKLSKENLLHLRNELQQQIESVAMTSLGGTEDMKKIEVLENLEKEIAQSDDPKEVKKAPAKKTGKLDGIMATAGGMMEGIGGKLSYAAEQLMQVWEMVQDTFSGMGSSTLLSIAKMMETMKMDQSWINAIRGFATSEKAVLQSVLKDYGCVIVRDTTPDRKKNDNDALNFLRAEYKKFWDTPKNRQEVLTEKQAALPAVPPAVPGAAPVAQPQIAVLPADLQAKLTFETFVTQVIVPKVTADAIKDKPDDPKTGLKQLTLADIKQLMI